MELSEVVSSDSLEAENARLREQLDVLTALPEQGHTPMERAMLWHVHRLIKERDEAEAERDALRAELEAANAKAALEDEQYGEGKVRSHAYWKARYDALERESGGEQ